MAYRLPAETYHGRMEPYQQQQQQHVGHLLSPPSGSGLPPLATYGGHHRPPPFQPPGPSSAIYPHQAAEHAGWLAQQQQQQPHYAQQPARQHPYAPLPSPSHGGHWNGLLSDVPGGRPGFLPQPTLGHHSPWQYQEQPQWRPYAMSSRGGYLPPSQRGYAMPTQPPPSDSYHPHYHHHPQQHPQQQQQPPSHLASNNDRHVEPNHRRRPAGGRTSRSPERRNGLWRSHGSASIGSSGAYTEHYGQRHAHTEVSAADRAGRQGPASPGHWGGEGSDERRRWNDATVLRPRSPPRAPLPPKRRTKPRETYLASALSAPTRVASLADDDDEARRKLVLLDLNGSLVFRANKQQADAYRRRPFVGNFLAYLFARGFDVGVWSSAQPHSVRKMVQSLGLRTEVEEDGVPVPLAAVGSTGGDDKQQPQPSPDPAAAAAAGEVVLEVESQPKGRERLAAAAAADDEADDDRAVVLKVLWARDTFGLSPIEYNQKTETIKDLDLIWQHLNALPSSSTRARPYDARDTLLLDDSYTKTSCQPFNHLPVPDFGQALATSSAKGYRAALSLAYDGLERMQPEIRAELGPASVVDRSLLGIVGILERARGETNVAAWIRSGGLVPDLSDPAGWWTEESQATTTTTIGGPAAAEVEAGAVANGPSTTTSRTTTAATAKRIKKSKLRKTLGVDALEALVSPSRPSSMDAPSEEEEPPPAYQPTLAELDPTAQPPVPWYASPLHAAFWTDRGIVALRSLGIPLDFGMAVDFLPPTRAEIEAGRAERAERDLRRQEERRQQQQQQDEELEGRGQRQEAVAAAEQAKEAAALAPSS